MSSPDEVGVSTERTGVLVLVAWFLFGATVVVQTAFPFTDCAS